MLELLGNIHIPGHFKKFCFSYQHPLLFGYFFSGLQMFRSDVGVMVVILELFRYVGNVYIIEHLELS